MRDFVPKFAWCAEGANEAQHQEYSSLGEYSGAKLFSLAAPGFLTGLGPATTRFTGGRSAIELQEP